MLARSSILKHPLGVEVRTPLLVPSFSSKGFGIDPRGRSEVQRIFEVAAEFLTESMLISAYDLAYGHLERQETALTELVFVDSGGYEISDLVDLSDTFVRTVEPKPWSLAQLTEELERWPAHIPAVFVSYDAPNERRALAVQIESALELRRRHPQQLFALLIKPETHDQRYVQIDNIIEHAAYLAHFDIIGVTEKELGNSFIDRMMKLSRLRLALNDLEIPAPIHVFGCLDPVSVCLYFLAGAEIFDGLTWLRYAFDEDLAMYRHNYAARRIGIHRRDDFVKMKTMQDNLNYLSELQARLHRYLVTADYRVFGPHADIMSSAFELLRSKNGRAA